MSLGRERQDDAEMRSAGSPAHRVRLNQPGPSSRDWTDGAVPLLAEHRLDRPAQRPFTVADAQLAGPWLRVPERLSILARAVEAAAAQGADLVATPESYLSGYQFWLARTGEGPHGRAPPQARADLRRAAGLEPWRRGRPAGARRGRHSRRGLSCRENWMPRARSAL